MSDTYIAEIKFFPYNFAPRNWAVCDGQLLSIAQNTALFSILGTTYGGNGQTTFALPDLRGRTPLHHGQGPGLSSYQLGETAGVAEVTLTASELPMHRHAMKAATETGTTGVPGPANVLAGATIYGPDQNLVAMAGGAAPARQPHNNRQPFQTLLICICVQGIFPSRN